jgi:hypothetical protein
MVYFTATVYNISLHGQNQHTKNCICFGIIASIVPFNLEQRQMTMVSMVNSSSFAGATLHSRVHATRSVRYVIMEESVGVYAL